MTVARDTRKRRTVNELETSSRHKSDWIKHGSDLFGFLVEAEQVGQNFDFSTNGTEILADEVEPDFACAAGGQVER